MKLPKFNMTGTNVINAIGGLVIIYLLVLLGQTIKNNYDLGQQIQGLKGQISLMQAQKDSLAYSVQYDKTNSALDRAARSELGLQLPGEHVVIIPNDTPQPTPEQLNAGAKPAPVRSNEQQWLDFLAGRG